VRPRPQIPKRNHSLAGTLVAVIAKPARTYRGLQETGAVRPFRSVQSNLRSRPLIAAKRPTCPARKQPRVRPARAVGRIGNPSCLGRMANPSYLGPVREWVWPCERPQQLRVLHAPGVVNGAFPGWGMGPILAEPERTEEGARNSQFLVDSMTF